MKNRFGLLAIPGINAILISGLLLISCNQQRTEQKEEQISVAADTNADSDTSMNSISGNVTLNQITTYPNSVILTGMPDHRLVTVYKAKQADKTRERINKYSSYSGDYYEEEKEDEEHFMPGIDILYGYNLLNIAHYDLKLEKLNFLFDQPALVKTLYYPCYEQDSLDNKPINRDYFMVSVYDKDTNKDTLINRKDLRRFYHFDASCTVKTQLVPDDFSVVRSQYDPRNDVMYIFARHDTDHNGSIERKEPMNIFWIQLKSPTAAKPLY